jgi:hypothetical protein
MPFRPIDGSKIIAAPADPALPSDGKRPDAVIVRPRSRAHPALPTLDAALPVTSGLAQEPSPAPKRSHHIVDRTGPNWDENGDYVVGKNRPPRTAQWQKGQSGNPRGPKTKERLDPLAEFEKELMSEFKAKVNGEEVTLNLGTFVLNLLKGGAAKGTVKSQQMLLELFLTTVRNKVERNATPEMMAWEQEVVDRMLEEHGLPAAPVVRKQRGGENKDTADRP